MEIVKLNKKHRLGKAGFHIALMWTSTWSAALDPITVKMVETWLRSRGYKDVSDFRGQVPLHAVTKIDWAKCVTSNDRNLRTFIGFRDESILTMMMLELM